MEGWAEFLDEMKQYYGVDMGCLSGAPRVLRCWVPARSRGCCVLPDAAAGPPPGPPEPTHPRTPPTCHQAEDYRKEQLDYFSHTAAWTDVHPSQVVGSAAPFKSYDLHAVTLEELKAPLKVRWLGAARGILGSRRGEQGAAQGAAQGAGV